MIRVRLRIGLVILAFAGIAISIWLARPAVPWCETPSARMLRERNSSTGAFPRVEDLLQGVAAGKTVIIAHRGGMECEELDRAPENSIANVDKAVRMGLGGYETDLWRTSDGEFVIHHDNWLGRTTHTHASPTENEDRSRKVEHTSFAEIRGLHLRYPSGRVSTERVPRLREFLEAGRGRILFLVELKGDSPIYFPEIVSITEEAGAKEHVLFWITWKREFAELFERYVDRGIESARSSVVWRVKDQAEYEDVIDRFGSRIVDLKPSWDELKWEDHLHIPPHEHASLVDYALERGTVVLVSRLSSDSYLRTLHAKGVRVFMSRAPERHLTYLIEGRL